MAKQVWSLVAEVETLPTNYNQWQPPIAFTSFQRAGKDPSKCGMTPVILFSQFSECFQFQRKIFGHKITNFSSR